MRKTANDVIHLLLNKTPSIPALQPESSKDALLQLSTLLNRDTTPTIQPTPLVPAPQKSPPVPPIQQTHVLPTIRQQTLEEGLLEYYLKQQEQLVTPIIPSPATSKVARQRPPYATSKGARNPPGIFYNRNNLFIMTIHH